jgi:hypothetical protein
MDPENREPDVALSFILQYTTVHLLFIFSALFPHWRVRIAAERA